MYNATDFERYYANTLVLHKGNLCYIQGVTRAQVSAFYLMPDGATKPGMTALDEFQTNMAPLVVRSCMVSVHKTAAYISRRFNTRRDGNQYSKSVSPTYIRPMMLGQELQNLLRHTYTRVEKRVPVLFPTITNYTPGTSELVNRMWYDLAFPSFTGFRTAYHMVADAVSYARAVSNHFAISASLSSEHPVLIYKRWLVGIVPSPDEVVLYDETVQAEFQEKFKNVTVSVEDGKNKAQTGVTTIDDLAAMFVHPDGIRTVRGPRARAEMDEALARARNLFDVDIV